MQNAPIKPIKTADLRVFHEHVQQPDSIISFGNGYKTAQIMFGNRHIHVKLLQDYLYAGKIGSLWVQFDLSNPLTPRMSY
jgi:hypothetical protein